MIVNKKMYRKFEKKVLSNYKFIKERRLLLEENDSLKQRNERLQTRINDYEQFNVIPNSLFIEILKLMPTPKDFKINGCNKKYELEIQPEASPKYSVNLEMVKLDDRFLIIRVKELGIRFIAECVLKSGGYKLAGVSTSISAWFWNWSKSGLTIISDCDFYLITDLVKAQANIINEE